MFKSAKETIKNTKQNLAVEKHFRKYLKWHKAQGKPAYHMTEKMKKEYVDYFRYFGFRHVSTDWAEFIYGINGEFDRRYVPDDIFNLYIDPVYPDTRDFWQNKVYQHIIVPCAVYPDTIVRRFSGYYIDENRQIISEKKALYLINQCGRVVIKPSIMSGGGKDVRFYDGADVTTEILKSHGSDFIVQKKIMQSELMNRISSNAVSTEKIVSFFSMGMSI